MRAIVSATLASLVAAVVLLPACGQLADPYRHGGVEVIFAANAKGPSERDRDQALGRTVEILRARMKNTRGAEVRLLADGRILVRLPLVHEASRYVEPAISRVTRTAKLEFKLVRPLEEFEGIFVRLDSCLVAREGGGKGATEPARQHPLTTHSLTTAPPPFVPNQDLPVVEKLIATPVVDSILSPQLELLWGPIEDFQGAQGRALYVIERHAVMNAGGSIAIAEAMPGLVSDNPGAWGVTVKMTLEGRDDFARVTGANVGRHLAIVLDDEVYSVPTIRERITDGELSITGGNVDAASARDLANALSAGALPVQLEVVEKKPISPQ